MALKSVFSFPLFIVVFLIFVTCLLPSNKINIIFVFGNKLFSYEKTDKGKGANKATNERII